MERVKTQLSRLWSPHCVRLFSAPLTEIVSRLPEVPSVPEAAASLQHAPQASSGPRNMLKKALEKTKAATSSTAALTSATSASSHHTRVAIQ